MMFTSWLLLQTINRVRYLKGSLHFYFYYPILFFTMTKYLFSTFMLFLLVVGQSWSQVSQTLHDVYTLDAGINQLILDVGDGNIEVRNTAASRISVETVVRVNGLSNDRMLSFLVEQGRYTLVAEKDLTKGTIRISNNKNRNVLMVKGQQCTEDLTYVVYVPNSIKTVENRHQSSPSAALPAPK